MKRVLCHILLLDLPIVGLVNSIAYASEANGIVDTESVGFYVCLLALCILCIILLEMGVFFSRALYQTVCFLLFLQMVFSACGMILERERLLRDTSQIHFVWMVIYQLLWASTYLLPFYWIRKSTVHIRHVRG